LRPDSQDPVVIPALINHPTKMKYLALGLQACFSATIFSPAPELCFGNLYQSILFVSLERGMKNTS